jgi:hypothetical protein
MPNCDPNTGVAYGVLSGHSVPDLDEEIFTNGTDESYKEWKENLEASIQSKLEDLDLPDHLDDERRNFAERYNAMREVLEELLRSEYCYSEKLMKNLMEHADVTNGEFDIDKVKEEMVDTVGQDLQIEEPVHSHTDGDTVYQRSHLGGAALIWVFKSRYVTPCRACSPCVPGAGSLEQACDPQEANTVAYCPPPQDWGVDDQPFEEQPYVIYHTDDQGFPTEEVAWQRKEPE